MHIFQITSLHILRDWELNTYHCQNQNIRILLQILTKQLHCNLIYQVSLHNHLFPLCIWSDHIFSNLVRVELLLLPLSYKHWLQYFILSHPWWIISDMKFPSEFQKDEHFIGHVLVSICDGHWMTSNFLLSVISVRSHMSEYYYEAE
jgi:hypothetical protein